MPNERQAGAAIEGVVRQERVEVSQLAVDTHGYTDFAMALSELMEAVAKLRVVDKLKHRA